jgi:hypothetical protein
MRSSIESQKIARPPLGIPSGRRMARWDDNMLIASIPVKKI